MSEIAQGSTMDIGFSIPTEKALSTNHKLQQANECFKIIRKTSLKAIICEKKAYSMAAIGTDHQP